MGQIEDKNNNALDHVIRLIGYHPEYLKHFLKTQNYLLRGDGPLPYDYRNYIAIMASARHQCTCLINHYKEEFTAQGGKAEWLQGLEYIPQKLRDLNEINKILAHKPWMLNKLHIEKLTKGRHNWSVGELVQAVVLLAHFHCLCSFVAACGILDDAEQPTANGAACKATRRNSEEETVEELMEKMNVLQQCKEKLSKPLESPLGLSQCTADSSARIESDMLRFVDDRSFIYKDSASCHDHSLSTFLIQDCSWDDHAYSLLDRFYNGTILDEKFKVAYDLTYYTMGHKKNVDTTIFRCAVWNYIHRIFGIIHDDYNYTEVEELLEHNFRTYIETVCFFPERITKNAHDGIMRAFRYSEKVHVNLMIFEARMQAELLYALYSIMHYMT